MPNLIETCTPVSSDRLNLSEIRPGNLDNFEYITFKDPLSSISFANGRFAHLLRPATLLKKMFSTRFALQLSP